MNYLCATLLLFTVVSLSGCYTFTGWGTPQDDIALLDSLSYSSDPKSNTSDTEDQTEKEKIVEMKKDVNLKNTPLGDDEGIEQAAKFYADTICLFSDPNFWDGFFSEDNTPAHERTEQEKADAFYNLHGYQDETHANKDLERAWGDDLFKDSVIENISSRCQDAPKEAGLNIQEELEKPLGL